MFSKLMNKKVHVYSPANGLLIPIEDVNDDLFSSKVMGEGFAVYPNGKEIYSPVDGEISSVFPTKHAITIKSKSSGDILIHMGIDTVELNGEGFSIMVKEGEKVKAGDKIACMDLEKIVSVGKDTCVMVIFLDKEIIKKCEINKDEVSIDDSVMTI